VWKLEIAIFRHPPIYSQPLSAVNRAAFGDEFALSTIIRTPDLAAAAHFDAVSALWCVP